MESVLIDLLRTPELQRLRRIRQTGLVHLVFPCAEHSRLAHVLGAAYLAVRFSRQIRDVAHDVFISDLCPDEAVIRDMGIAALCHDLGHGPLSHYWEREIIGSGFNREAWAKALGLPTAEDFVNKFKWHELVGHSLLRWPEGQLHRLLEQHEQGTSDRISRLLRGEYYLPYMSRLLASDLDVDRADFIRRDTYQTGVAYGRYDLDWLISTCCIGDKKETGGRSEWVIGFDAWKSVRVIEQFLTARSALYETVYHHKTVRCAEGMMALFLRRLKRAVQDGYQPKGAGDFTNYLTKLINGETLGPRELLKLDDFAIWILVDIVAGAEAKDLKDDTARDLAWRITSRDLFKRVRILSVQLQQFLAQPYAQEQIREAIKPFCPGDPEFYFFIDYAKFEMLSQKESDCIYLIDGLKAMSVLNHPQFTHYRDATRTTVRLYTIREALPAVESLIRGRTES